MANILIADDHDLVRKGLRQLLEENFPHSRLDEASTGPEVLKLARSAREGSRYDLMILDYSMPGKEGLDLIRDLKDIDPTTHVLVLSILPEEQYAVRAFRMGASGCVNKAIPLSELLEAVRTVLGGHRYLSQKAQELLLGEVGRAEAAVLHERLSDREFQLLRLLASGKSVGEIAELFSLSVKTVSTYRVRLLEKMGMQNNAQLISYAFRQGLVDEASPSV